MASLSILLLVACGGHPTGRPEAEKTKGVPADFLQEKEPQPVPSPAQPKESAGRKVKPAKILSSNPFIDEAPKDRSFEKVDWGREITLDEIIAMAKSGQIQEIEWHVMPNIIRAQASDGRIFHLRNENKGIDIRNTLINEGVHIGKGGISFRHVF